VRSGRSPVRGAVLANIPASGPHRRAEAWPAHGRFAGLGPPPAPARRPLASASASRLPVLRRTAVGPVRRPAGPPAAG